MKPGRVGTVIVGFWVLANVSIAADFWALPPDRARELLRSAPFAIRSEERTAHGTSGTREVELWFPGEQVTLRAKWKEVPPGGDGINNSPRKEIAADELQRLVLPESNYVAPPTVLRCIPLDEVPAAMRPERPTLEGTSCVLGTLSLWLEEVTVPENLWSPERFARDPDYANAMGDLNFFTYLIDHRDGREGNILVSEPGKPERAFAIDNGISFNPWIWNFFVPNWHHLRVPALPEAHIARLRGLAEERFDGLAIVAEMRSDGSGVLRPRAAGKNLDPEVGARLAPGAIQLGLTTSEIRKLKKRVRKLLEDVDSGEVLTFSAEAGTLPAFSPPPSSRRGPRCRGASRCD